MQIFIGAKTLSHFFKLAQSLKRIFTNYSRAYTCTHTICTYRPPSNCGVKKKKKVWTDKGKRTHVTSKIEPTLRWEISGEQARLLSISKR